MNIRFLSAIASTAVYETWRGSEAIEAKKRGGVFTMVIGSSRVVCLKFIILDAVGVLRK